MSHTQTTRTSDCSKFCSLSSKLSPEGKQIVSTLLSELDKLRTDFSDMVSAKTQSAETTMISEFDKLRDNFSEMLASKTEEITELRSEVQLLKKKVSILEEHVDGANAYGRRDCIIISGGIPAETQGENCVELVRNVFKEKLRLEIATSDISTAHRLGKRSQASDHKPSIIIKLCRRDIKRDIFSASKQQIQSPGRIFVNESLTPLRSTIFYALRRMKRDHPNIIKGCTTIDGKVIIVFTAAPPSASAHSRDVRHLVNSREKLELFCSEYI